jgi:glutathione peroxidase
MNIYDFEVFDVNNNPVSLKKYKGKVLLIVNTAIKCGFTVQYEGLENLYQQFKNYGFEILDFPCNQFANQAPGSNEELANFCALKYHTTFKTFAKIKVNGKEASPLYNYLKSVQPGDTKSGRIKWNFTKFLVNRNGQIVARYPSNVTPQAIAKDIAKLL